MNLVSGKDNCCGCAACYNICPNNAIEMKPDIDGFIFPIINNDRCTECKLCIKVCAFKDKSISGNKPMSIYAATAHKDDILKSSSSGGAFTAIAHEVLKDNGVVFGCSLSPDMNSKHISINNINEIANIQGSKYIQSDIGNSYQCVQRHLKEGKKVFFVGTPCQVAALYKFLGAENENLLTADLICKGVPSSAFFKEYITHMENKLHMKIKSFKFRDKNYGWGLKGTALFTQSGIDYVYKVTPYNSYYYYYFKKNNTCRESCYKCKFADSARVGDFTLGDYWGIGKFHPEIDSTYGVSLILINTKKASEMVFALSSSLKLINSDMDLAKVMNNALVQPSKKGNNKDKIMYLRQKGGAQLVEKYFYRHNLFIIILSKIYTVLPCYLKKMIIKLIS